MKFETISLQIVVGPKKASNRILDSDEEEDEVANKVRDAVISATATATSRPEVAKSLHAEVYKTNEKICELEASLRRRYPDGMPSTAAAPTGAKKGGIVNNLNGQQHQQGSNKYPFPEIYHATTGHDEVQTKASLLPSNTHTPSGPSSCYS